MTLVEALVLIPVAVGAVLGMVAGLVAVFAILNGFVVSKLWLWFAVPLGLHPLSIPQAIGVYMLIKAFTYSENLPNHLFNKEQSRQRMIQLCAIPFVQLACGWIIKTYFL